jgi:hypothetical protein
MKQELKNVHEHDRAKLEKTLKGTESNFKYKKDGEGHHHFNHKKGWKNSRSYKNKNFSAHSRIEYIKEKKRKQSEHDKMLNELHPERNQEKVEPEVIKNDEKQVISKNHANFRGARIGRR